MGLGAAILQDGHPVAFASKSLNSAQRNYPNIYREMLAVVFGIARSHIYLYVHPFQVITDHKPLEMIARRPRPQSTTHAAEDAPEDGIRLHHPVLPWKDDGTGRHSVKTIESK